MLVAGIETPKIYSSKNIQRRKKNHFFHARFKRLKLISARAPQSDFRESDEALREVDLTK